jgi:hypothetical protein
MAIDYYEVQEALTGILSADATLAAVVKSFFIEAMEKEIIIGNMPIINVRLIATESEVRAGQSYYEHINYEIDVAVANFTHFREAAKLRDDILGRARDVIQANPRFHVALESTLLIPLIRFGALSPEGAGGHCALATFSVRCEAYYDAA